MRTTFTLPIGALIEIRGRTFEYLGDGRLIGQTEADVPVVIEALFHVPNTAVSIVKLERADEEHAYNERVVFFCEA